jgi:hypothetical protein
MSRKTIILVFFILAIAFKPGRADEGMWLPFLINDMLYEEMQEMGLELTREEIFSFNQSSIKDAVVSFGGGCTAEIISPEGLLLTNHHCGYGRIQYHSTPENDYLKNGFWAMSKDEELPNPGLFVRFLVSVTDVTEPINAQLTENMSVSDRSKKINELSDSISKAATQGNNYSANVRAMFSGNDFYLFVYERYNDVRLVGAPPSSIGKFGGDTDNWMWPRHTGDFTLFRIYTAPDGSPATYHPDNIPLKPKHFLPVSTSGVKEGDFSMILGFPGSTDRFLTSHGIDYKVNVELPKRIEIRRAKLDIIEEAMASSDEIRIKYASKQSGISNYWKNFIGMKNALQKHDVADQKREQEKQFTDWVAKSSMRQNEYGDVLSTFDKVYDAYNSFGNFTMVHSEAISSGADVLRFARSFNRLHDLLQADAPDDEIRNETERLKLMSESFYRNYIPSVDQKLWSAMMETYNNSLEPELKAGIFEHINRRFKGDYDRFASEVYKKSIFADKEKFLKFLDAPKKRTLERDWAFRTATSIFDNAEVVLAQIREYNEMLLTARRLFVKGVREMNPDGMFYPDANSTMRFTYGTVKGYKPADAVYYDFSTTLDGVMEKENPDHHEFIVPEKLSNLYHLKDFGSYGSNGSLPVNFVSNNDITGGNSGSPVLDGSGNLIGLAFDGNWEAMSGDILFEHNLQRTISVDARYILFVIDKFAGAGYLLDEMELVD